jgi:dephospho-CoA kinase
LNSLLSILKTSPKAIAPLIIPEYHMKINYLIDIPLLYPNNYKNIIKNIVLINLPTIMTISSIKNKCGDHSNSK